ncbi:Protein SPIRAL1-like 2 [Striga hermonthica]|uniref:Protein SPIRAL1-like 2 n=1 Tax=Striga hermonthica TaxID=68872 RepID=A0A9N7NSE5_STRHE|nr:Protein SPIRAL1-like 2 [Striga hermonthica]
MKRGESAGGGQSSLGYLFGSDENDNNSKNKPPPPSPTTCLPPYGTDIGDNKPPESPNSPSPNKGVPGRQNSGNFTGRPSTRVTSAPGGDSSLGYLFSDDKS